RGKALGEPLWRLAGGARRSIPLYDTEGGWLQLSTEELVEGALEAGARGFRGVKLKVGKPDPHEDLERLRSVRETLGSHMDLMVDANQSLTYPDGKRRARPLEEADQFCFGE